MPNESPPRQEEKETYNTGSWTLNALEQIYGQFILLDLIGKITPGAIVLITILTIKWNLPDVKMDLNNLNNLSSMATTAGTILDTNISFLGSILFITISWIIGFAMQGLGLKLRRYIQIFDIPKDMSNNVKFIYYNYLYKKCNRMEINQFHRFNVIKEASGNGCVALLFSLLLVLINLLFVALYNHDSISLSSIKLEILYTLAMILYTPAICVILIVSLHKLHNEYVTQTYVYLSTLIKQANDIATIEAIKKENPDFAKKMFDSGPEACRLEPHPVRAGQGGQDKD